MTLDTISNEDPGQEPAFGARGGAPTPLRSGARATALTTALSLVLVGGVVTAAVRSSGRDTTAEALAPASTFAFAQIDLGLADGQGSALSSFLNHFPDSPTKKGNGSLRDRLLRAMLRDSSGPHVDYAKDVKPWLGDHAAVAGWVDASGKAQAEFLLQSKNVSAARASLHRVAPELGVRFSKGYAVIGQTQHAADAALSAAQKSSLAGDAHLHGDLDRLSGPQVVTGWLDSARAGQALRNVTKGVDPLSMLPGGLMGGLTGGVHSLDQLKGRAVIGLHVTKTYAELVAQTIGGGSTSTSGASPDLLTRLPDGTIGAVEIASPGKIVTAAWGFMSMFLGAADSFSSSVAVGAGSSAYNSTLQACPSSTICPIPPVDPKRIVPAQPPSPSTSPVQQIEKVTGLKLPGDAMTLLGSAMVASYGGLQGRGLPNVALVTQPADLAAARALAEHSRDVVERSSGVSLSVGQTGSDLVVATNSGYGRLIETGGHLGSQARFTRAMGQLPDQVAFAAYVDLADVLPLLAHGQPDADHLDAVGIWAGRSGGDDRMQFRLVVK